MTSHTTSTSTGGGSNPSAWPADTLDRFGAADEIDISTAATTTTCAGSCRSGSSPSTTPSVRALPPRTRRRLVPTRHRATGRRDPDRRGQQADVTFTPIDPHQRDLLEAIGDAYRAKYGRYGDRYLQPMLAEQAVAATLRLIPRT
jgi:hypothetical protein